jgi:hypothetical protein
MDELRSRQSARMNDPVVARIVPGMSRLKWTCEGQARLAYTAIDPARQLFSCNCGKATCKIAGLTPFREHIKGLYNAIASTTELQYTAAQLDLEGEWQATMFSLQMAASIEDAFANTSFVEIDDTDWMCSPYDDGILSSEIAAKYVAGLAIFNFLWAAYASGATEANNIALQGIARSPQRRGNHVVTCASEHLCVLDTGRYLEQNGFQVTHLPVDRNGLVTAADLSIARTCRSIYPTFRIFVGPAVTAPKPVSAKAANMMLRSAPDLARTSASSRARPDICGRSRSATSNSSMTACPVSPVPMTKAIASRLGLRPFTRANVSACRNLSAKSASAKAAQDADSDSMRFMKRARTLREQRDND